MTSLYPPNFTSALGKPLKFPPATLRAVRAFARSKPWRGSLAERQQKFEQLHADLSQIYNLSPTLTFLGNNSGDSGRSFYDRHSRIICLRGRFSVITFLHEWGHVLRGRSEYEACRWSLRLFRRCFPRSFSRLRWEGHVARAGRES